MTNTEIGIKLQELARLWLVNIEEVKSMGSFFTIDNINDNFQRKIMVRNFFAVVEGYLYVTRELIKLILIKNKNINYGITFHEMIALNGKAVSLDKTGQAIGKDTFYPFEANLPFTLNCFAKILETPKPDYSDNGYAKLIRMSKRRNDITHPKSAGLQIITDNEIKDILLGLGWFIRTHGQTATKINFNELFLQTPPPPTNS